MNRIHWTADEKELVVEAMAEKLQQQPRMRYAELWEAGNAILALNRQRKWYSGYGGKERPLFEEARARMALYLHRGAPQKPVPEPAKQHIPMQQQQEVMWVPVPTPQTLAEVPLKELLAEVIGRVLDRMVVSPFMEQAIGKEAAKEFTSFQRVVSAIPDLPKARPVRIALCGPLKDQFNRVKERINGKKVELVHVDNQKSVDAQDWKGGIDYAVVTRFMRHSHSELANQYVGKERVHWVPQGTDSIVAKISELVPGSVN